MTCKIFTIGVEVQREGDRASRSVLEISGKKKEGWLLEKKKRQGFLVDFFFFALLVFGFAYSPNTSVASTQVRSTQALNHK